MCSLTVTDTSRMWCSGLCSGRGPLIKKTGVFLWLKKAVSVALGMVSLNRSIKDTCFGALFKFPMSTIVFLIREPHPSHQRWKGEGGYFMDTCKVYLQWLTVAMAPHIGCTSNTYYIVFLYNTEIEVDQCNLLLLFSRVLQFYLCIFLQILPVMLPRPNRRLMASNLNFFDTL